MVELRERKIAGIAATIPPVEVLGDESGELLVVGWGSTYGAITTAVERCRKKGMSVSSVHLRHLEPMASNVGDVLKRFDHVLVAELNRGQLLHRLRSRFLVDAQRLNKVQGTPFLISEIESKIEEMLKGGKS